VNRLSCFFIFALLSTCAAAPPATAADTTPKTHVFLDGEQAANPITPRQARDALRTAAMAFQKLALRGGYAGIWSADMSERYGEAFFDKLPGAYIWIQPPGTPSVGQTFLRAYRATGDSFYLDAAKDAARALAWTQSRGGGWDYTADVSGLAPGAKSNPHRNLFATFDDNTTQGALLFLMDLDRDVDAPWLDRAISDGLNFIIEAQFPNGAWPQWYPLKGGYYDHYTFNDGALNDCIGVLLAAYDQYKAEKYLKSALAGADFIIASQLPAPQAGWAQQYGKDMQPAWARAFEPPSVSPAPTARNIRTLMDFYLRTGDQKYLAPIPAAIDWLVESQLDDGPTWARMYELQTNTPIYGDRDGKVRYTLDEISEERRTGYGWRGTFGAPEAAVAYFELNSMGRALYLDRRDSPLPPEEQEDRDADIRANARQAIMSLNSSGFWIHADNYIYSEDFVAGVTLLCDYLEMN
jgi:hypothetical protein